jgi:hypothetical protein
MSDIFDVDDEWEYESDLSRLFEGWDQATKDAYLDEHDFIMIKHKKLHKLDDMSEHQVSMSDKFRKNILDKKSDPNQSDDEFIEQFINDALKNIVDTYG